MYNQYKQLRCAESLIAWVHTVLLSNDTVSQEKQLFSYLLITYLLEHCKILQ